MRKKIALLMFAILTACTQSSKDQTGMDQKTAPSSGCDGSCCPHKCTRPENK